MSMQHRLWIIALSAASLQPALAADYPTKPVRIIVPFPAGAAADGSTRAIARKLSEYWGKPVIVDNRPGIPGMQVAANAPADGYTFVLGSGASMVTSPLTMPSLPYSPQKDFAPVSLGVTNPPILTTHPSLGVKSVKELIALAKSKPGALNYSSSGTAGPFHLGMELFMAMTGTSMVHVPYKGGAPAVADLIGGQVQLGFNTIPTVMPHVKAGRLTPIGVGTAGRARAAPDLPSIAETVPAFDYSIWYGYFAPARTPAAIVNKVSADIARALAEPDVVQQLQGSEPAPTTPQELARYIREDTARWAKVVKERNLKVE
ncbi:MAG: Bug family tripartite tricarboxylate transporter substrate binding protein [Burkholderiales bacterium]